MVPTRNTPEQFQLEKQHHANARTTDTRDDAILGGGPVRHSADEGRQGQVHQRATRTRRNWAGGEQALALGPSTIHAGEQGVGAAGLACCAWARDQLVCQVTRCA